MLGITLPLLAIHLLCVNLASAGPLICIYYEWRENRGALAAGRAGRSLAAASIVALLIGVATGLLIGWIRWGPELQSGLTQLSRKVTFGSMEIVFSLALMVWHWWWWRGPESRGRIGRYFVLLLAGTNLLYHFPTLFSVLAHLQAEGPSDAAISPSEFRRLLVQPNVLAQAIHVAVACFAVAGAWLIWRADRSQDPADRATARPAAGIALVATILQLPIGMWLTVVYPSAQQRQMMGQDLWATTAFVLSLLAALSLLHHLAAVAFRADCGNSRRISVILTIGIVALMSSAMWLSR